MNNKTLEKWNKFYSLLDKYIDLVSASDSYELSPRLYEYKRSLLNTDINKSIKEIQRMPNKRLQKMKENKRMRIR